MAMLPPQQLTDSQESSVSSMSNGTSYTSFPTNVYAPSSVKIDYTPPSSASQPESNDGSQPTAAPSAQFTKQHGQAYSPEMPSESRTSSASSPTSGISGSPTQGSKRTASGAVKLPNGYHLPSPERGRKTFHSRTQSMDTTTSSVGELSAQLKSRLSYAMAKVQSGNLSQVTSPMSVTSTPRDPAGATSSTRAAVANTTRHSQNLSRAMNAPDAHSDNYWTGPRSTLSESYERGQPMPLLAPAPDFKAPTSNMRRTNGLHRTHDAGSKQSTPQMHRARTPTQQEQEAVDTLIFMSSPKNTNRYSRDSAPSSQQSPLRSGFARPARAMPDGTPSLAHMGSTSSDEDYSGRRVNGIRSHADEQRDAKRRSLGFGALKSGGDVERLLDTIASEERGGSHSPDLNARGRLDQEQQPAYVNGVVR